MFITPITISVIIPAYNASATIGRTLEALSRQKCNQPFEVIVVDDGSCDNTADIVCSFAAARYVRQDNAGPACARNHGANLARGKFLAFTDSDCIPHEDWISRLMETFGQQEIGVVCGSYGIANPKYWLARCVYKEILWRHTRLMPDYPNAFGSYNFCVRKEVFDAIGGFNSAYRHASGEDNDLSYKITQSGWRIYFQRKALVDHYHTVKVVKYLKEQFRHGFWRVKMYMDHPRMMSGDGYTFWKDIIEMPLAGGLFLGLALSAFHYIRLVEVVYLILVPFLFFEIYYALIMTRCFFEGILFGFVLLFRAFARMIGFSTGIVAFLF
ncbi:MAG: glycosyltransferase [Candidatus Omnitrophica bacterium]|nr:glycosyltransferase [Candidatus Omnitrophota bacterium]